MAEIKNIKDYISKDEMELNPVSTVIASIGAVTAYKLLRKDLPYMAKYYKINGTALGTTIISLTVAVKLFSTSYNISEVIRKGIITTVKNIKEVKEENENGGSET